MGGLSMKNCFAEIVQDNCYHFINCLQLAKAVKNGTSQILPQTCPTHSYAV
jgi:hypothetical protein